MTRRGEIRRERVAAIVCARGKWQASAGSNLSLRKSQKEETKERREEETSAQISNLDDLITNRSRDVRMQNAVDTHLTHVGGLSMYFLKSSWCICSSLSRRCKVINYAHRFFVLFFFAASSKAFGEDSPPSCC